MLSEDWLWREDKKKFPYSSCKEEKMQKNTEQNKNEKTNTNEWRPKEETKKHKNKKRAVWCSFLDKWVISPNNIKYIIM